MITPQLEDSSRRFKPVAAGPGPIIDIVDADGVALAAIQGLNQKLENRLQVQETEIVELKRTLEKLKQLVDNLPSTHNRP